jgi:hypothetical protein
MMDKPDTGLRYTRRRLKDADVYLFFNEGSDPSFDTVTLKSNGQRAELWDPQTGKLAPAQTTYSKEAMKIHLELQPYETRVVVVR